MTDKQPKRRKEDIRYKGTWIPSEVSDLPEIVEWDTKIGVPSKYRKDPPPPPLEKKVFRGQPLLDPPGKSGDE